MISATSLNGPSPLNKGHQIPLGLENGRLRVDSQKFLVPLPVSARAGGGHHNVDPKRRERSIVNGTAHPHPHPPPPQSDYSHHHHPSLSLSHNYQNLNINGFRTSYHNPHGGSGGRDSSPSSPQNRTSSSPQHPYLHLNNSPRKDAHSPMYAGEVPGHGHSPGGGSGSGGNYSHRSSLPIPCSSPAQGSSASPKGSHSPSGIVVSSGNYSPKLPSGPSPMLPPPPSELNSLAAAGRLYPGFPPPHPSVAAHLSPAFYAAAAAAAASHSLPYPIFGVGPSFNPHSHSAAAASAYLDSFHSALVHRGPTSGDIQHQQHQNQNPRSRSPSPSPPNRSHSSGHRAYHPAQQHPHQQQSLSHSHSHHLNSSPSSTSVTSLHNKLIESTTVSSADRDRHGYNNGHNHQPHHGGHFPPPQSSPPSMGLSKGGPLGISGGIMNLPSSRLSNGTSKHQPSSQQPQPENLVVHKSSPSPQGLNGYHLSANSKQWLEHHGLNPNDPINRKLVLELEARHNQNKDNGSQQQSPHKQQQRAPPQSPPQDMSIPHSPKIPKNISFASDTYPPNHTNSNNRYPNPIPNNIHHQPQNQPSYAYLNGHAHHQQIHMQRDQQQNNNAGILTDSNHAKKQVNNNHLVHNNPPQPPSHNSQQSNQSHSSGGQFLPPSPKKRAGQWNFAVPANPGSKVDLPPPPPPPPLSHTFTPEQIKYLNNSNQNLNKPSNNHHPHQALPVPNSANTFHSQQQSAQPQNSFYPSSPRLPGSGPSTPKSPAVHQVKFSFSSGSSKENLKGGHKQGGNSKSGRNDSSSSSSSNEGNVPWPVEQMPILEAFKRGSLIKLANGDLRPVEDLKAEDFIHAAANMSSTLKIIHCTVLSIQQSESGTNGNSSLCKVTMMVGSQLHNQQVIVPSSPEQPFFVLGRGWSSLSPKTTEKLLQLPCSSLAVGDVCITLSKSTPHPTPLPTQVKGQSQLPKSPSTRGRKPGSGRGGANAVGSPTTKRALASATLTQSSLKQSGENKGGKSTAPAESIKRHSMGPPLTPSADVTITNSTPPASGTVKVINKKETEVGIDDSLLLRPPSPKRRRWSAPEPDIPLSTPPATPSALDADKLMDKSVKDKVESEHQVGGVCKIFSPPLTPSSPPCQKTGSPLSTPEPVSKMEEEDERTLPASDKDKKMEIETPSGTTTDVNSNVNVKDNIKINVTSPKGLDQTARGNSSSDAQSKA